jgi:hypothetical protein
MDYTFLVPSVSAAAAAAADVGDVLIHSPTYSEQ